MSDNIVQQRPNSADLLNLHRSELGSIDSQSLKDAVGIGRKMDSCPDLFRKSTPFK